MIVVSASVAVLPHQWAPVGRRFPGYDDRGTSHGLGSQEKAAGNHPDREESFFHDIIIQVKR